MMIWLLSKRLGIIWKVSTLAGRAMAALLGVSVGARTRFAGLPLLAVLRKGQISIGARVVLASRSEATALGLSQLVVLRCLTHEATIVIGDDSGLSGTVICAARRVVIGKRCLAGANVTIFDTDFHPHEPENRRYAVPDWDKISAPVTIGDDVFLGTGATIQKGVTIGDGAIVAARSVVVKDVAPMTVVGGNPAKLLRNLGDPGARSDHV